MYITTHSAPLLLIKFNLRRPDMPTHLVLANKSIVINAKTQEILIIYNKVLNKNLKTNEVEHKDNNLSPGIEQLHGPFARLFEKIASPFADIKIGGNASKLPEIELNMDAPAYLIWESYVEFWNNLVKNEHIGPAETENENLQSVFALVREIFIRLAAVALSDNTKWKIGGERMVKLIHSFSEEIEKANSLDPAPNKLSDLKKEFLSKHHAWISDIKNAASAVELIHTNTQAISITMQYLYDLRNTIMRLLIAELDNSKDTSDLSENWIKQTLQECELSFIKKCKEEKIQANHTITHEADTVQFLVESGRIEEESASRQEQVIILGVAFSSAGESYNRIRGLYKILNKTNVLLFMASQLDVLFTIGGWIPLLTRAIKIENFTNLLREHREFCTPILSASSIAIQKTTAKILKGLKHYNALSLVKVRDDKVIIQLEKLENPVLIKKLKNGILTSLQSLSKAESILGYQFNIIDIRQMSIQGTDRSKSTQLNSSTLQIEKDQQSVSSAHQAEKNRRDNNSTFPVKTPDFKTKETAKDNKKATLDVLPVISNSIPGRLEGKYKGKHLYFNEISYSDADNNLLFILNLTHEEFLTKLLSAINSTSAKGVIVRNIVVETIKTAISSNNFQLNEDKMPAYRDYLNRSKQISVMLQQLASQIRQQFSNNKELVDENNETILRWGSQNETCKKNIGNQISVYNEFKLQSESLIEKICLDVTVINVFFKDIYSRLVEIDDQLCNKALNILAEVEHINFIVWIRADSKNLNIYHLYAPSEQPAWETKHLLLNKILISKNIFTELLVCTNRADKQNTLADHSSKSEQVGSMKLIPGNSFHITDASKLQWLYTSQIVLESLYELSLPSLQRQVNKSISVTSIISISSDTFAYVTETKTSGVFGSTTSTLWLVNAHGQEKDKFDLSSTCRRLYYITKSNIIICYNRYDKIECIDLASRKTMDLDLESVFNDPQFTTSFWLDILQKSGLIATSSFSEKLQVSCIAIVNPITKEVLTKIRSSGTLNLCALKNNDYVVTYDHNFLILFCLDNENHNIKYLKKIRCKFNHHPYPSLYILPDDRILVCNLTESSTSFEIVDPSNDNVTNLYKSNEEIIRVYCGIIGMIITVSKNNNIMGIDYTGKLTKLLIPSAFTITALAAASDNTLLIGNAAGKIARWQFMLSNNLGNNPNALFSSHQEVKSNEQQQSTMAPIPSSSKNSI